MTNLQEKATAFVDAMMPRLSNGDGRGIVICGGGHRLFTNAWVCINILRHLGCQLPIQLWHRGELEMDHVMRDVVTPLGVRCVDGWKVASDADLKMTGGWQMKSLALLFCPFKEVMLLDADNVPVIDPTYLFDTRQFRTTGALFWPDYGRLGRDRAIWDACGVPYRDEPEIESGQIVVNKERCLKALCLAMHYNEASDFYYNHIHGDKCTFQMAFHRLHVPYSMPKKGIHSLDSTMCQHDFDGRRVFQHRNMDKWNYDGSNKKVGDFVHENVCRKFLAQLRKIWNGRVWFHAPNEELAGKVAGCVFRYTRIGLDERLLRLNKNQKVGQGAAANERFWNTAIVNDEPSLFLIGDKEPTCRLVERSDGFWTGRWYNHERAFVNFRLMQKGSRKVMVKQS